MRDCCLNRYAGIGFPFQPVSYTKTIYCSKAQSCDSNDIGKHEYSSNYIEWHYTPYQGWEWIGVLSETQDGESEVVLQPGKRLEVKYAFFSRGAKQNVEVSRI